MRILITGASSGLGAELARRYAKPQNELILLARRQERLDALKAELLSHAKKVETITCDVADFEALQEAMRQIGHVHMVILNAGISIGHSYEVTPFSDFKRLYDVNVLSSHAILEILLPRFKEHGGKIVFISSLASLYTMPTSVAYGSSKRALNAYAEGIANKYGSYGVKVTTIMPGFIQSEMTDKNRFHMPFLLSTKEGVDRIYKAIESNKKSYAFPLRFYLIISLFRMLPNFLREMIIHSKIKK